MSGRHECFGFLYGHYDSRGGTTMVEAGDRETADRRYSQLFGDVDTTAAQEDFLGKAVLSSPECLTQEEELDSQDPAMVFLLTGGKLYDPADEENEDQGFVLEQKEPYCLWYAPDGVPPDQPATHPRWDDDAFSFIFLPSCATALRPG